MNDADDPNETDMNEGVKVYLTPYECKVLEALVGYRSKELSEEAHHGSNDHLIATYKNLLYKIGGLYRP